jgi:histidinol dehydrogenase
MNAAPRWTDCRADLRAALKLAADRIRAYHEKQKPEGQ